MGGCSCGAAGARRAAIGVPGWRTAGTASLVLVSGGVICQATSAVGGRGSSATFQAAGGLVVRGWGWAGRQVVGSGRRGGSR